MKMYILLFYIFYKYREVVTKLLFVFLLTAIILRLANAQVIRGPHEHKQNEIIFAKGKSFVELNCTADTMTDLPKMYSIRTKNPTGNDSVGFYDVIAFIAHYYIQFTLLFIILVILYTLIYIWIRRWFLPRVGRCLENIMANW